MGPTLTSPLKENLWNSWRKSREMVFSLSLGLYALHTVNNGFGEGLKQLKETLDVKQFLIGIYFFFKYSSARREDYKEMENLTDVTAEYLLKYCSTCWLYIGKVVVQIWSKWKTSRVLFDFFASTKRIHEEKWSW